MFPRQTGSLRTVLSTAKTIGTVRSDGASAAMKEASIAGTNKPGNSADRDNFVAGLSLAYLRVGPLKLTVFPFELPSPSSSK